MNYFCLDYSSSYSCVLQVTQRVYEHIDANAEHHSLRYTRHFGGMTFYLALYKKIEGLLVDMIQRQL